VLFRSHRDLAHGRDCGITGNSSSVALASPPASYERLGEYRNFGRRAELNSWHRLDL
jgi:hypothetical protein